jgi:hypothetical protein
MALIRITLRIQKKELLGRKGPDFAGRSQMEFQIVAIRVLVPKASPAFSDLSNSETL